MKKISIIMIVLSITSFIATVNASTRVKFEINRSSICNNGCNLGEFYINGQLVGKTLELPWLDNRSNISCIPRGTYFGKVRQDGNRGWRIELEDVPGRNYVQIHVGNYSSQIQGCILVGQYHDGCSVMNSSSIISKMRSIYNVSYNSSQTALSGVTSVDIVVTVN